MRAPCSGSGCPVAEVADDDPEGGNPQLSVMTVWATRADQVDLRGPNPHDLARSPFLALTTRRLGLAQLSIAKLRQQRSDDHKSRPRARRPTPTPARTPPHREAATGSRA